MTSVLRILAVAALVLVGGEAAFAQAVTAPVVPAAAATTVSPNFGPGMGAGIGMGLSILGAGIGLGLIGFAALSGIARQPEQAGAIRGVMILIAALVEGAAIISLVLCLLLTLL